MGFQHKYLKLLDPFLSFYPTHRDWTKYEDILRKTFTINTYFNNSEVSIINSISFPHSWSFKELDFDNEEGRSLNNKKYVVASPNNKVQLKIIPKSITNLRSVLSETTFTQEIKNRCLGSYSISELDEVEFITLYRENFSTNEIKYFQEINSVESSENSAILLEEFFIFKRYGGLVEGQNIIWTAEIILKFDDSIKNDEKEEYLEIIDDIVSSLQIQEKQNTASLGLFKANKK